MSHQVPLRGHHYADIVAAELDIFTASDHPALAAGPAVDALRRIEQQYQHVVELLVKEKSAAAAKIADLETTKDALLAILRKKMAEQVKGVFVKTHIVSDKKVVLRVGEEVRSGIFKEL